MELDPAVIEEITTLKSIYDDSFACSPDGRHLQLTHRFADDDFFTIDLDLPATYPSFSPPDLPSIEFSESSIRFPIGNHATKSDFMAELAAALLPMFAEGEVAIFTWLDHTVAEVVALHDMETQRGVERKERENVELASEVGPIALDVMAYALETEKTVPAAASFDVHTASTTIVDRKSVFQGICARCASAADVATILQSLKGNPKIARATHVISAYRIRTATGVLEHDCDDDGEDKAGARFVRFSLLRRFNEGARLLNLLTILNLENVVVFVVRWYGGTPLGARPETF
ncbi:hypothetical protein HK101_008388 [Irineochytrium annulatum]|nr:hypothetical protein HK101_008388 [Irineochytrium annulatum]